ncbi:BCCT family transporter [Salmonella enterica]|nr:BCCT family transporter [Salmonella enterica]
MSENDTVSKKSKSQLNKAVFFTSALLIFLLVSFAAVFPDVADKNFKLLQQQIFTNASWFYILAVALILLSVTFLGISRYGDIKLGPDHAQPDFSYHSWFAMLFSAGMGIGLMFFGVAEPVMHYLSPPVGTPETVAAAKEAMRLTFFHWGLHAWAIYAIVALILAFFSYRHGLPLTLRSALYPIIGDRIYGPVGHAVDIFAVIGTVFGVATSLGYGVLQVNAGLNHLFGVPINETVQVILIVVITGLATISVVSGLDKGIRILSELNLGLALLLLALVLCLGPTVLLLKSFVENTGGYLSELVSKTFNLYAYIALLLAGGLSALQTVTIASALPFSVILLISIYGLLKALRRDLTKRESLSMATIAPTAARNPIPWQRRLRNIAYLPKRSLVKRFMGDVILPAMTLVQEELNKQGTISHISDADDDRIRLEVDLGNELNFIYEVRLRGYNSPAFAMAAMDNDEQQAEQHRYYRAEIYLKEGGQNYDVMGWNQEQLINDILDQYEKHLHFLHLVR